MENPDADGYTKTLNHCKILRKTQINNLLKTKWKWGPSFCI